MTTRQNKTKKYCRDLSAKIYKPARGYGESIGNLTEKDIEQIKKKIDRL